ncbi:hypothetical protein FOG51_00547 [Hanseniaspora uvarum]|jgi:small subunit ribosomal protein S6|uniref:37S ribosomal protein MRP17, mitochondrial n=1 Tax=Hanseniaspora uvarum TaxID=29833 RepID=A0A1E5S0J6_HANUV|nr:hypothetical protein FOG48_02877 [Hanseniaspora uvarum]KAF0274529.1 hypothetical protein FOG51_00547 [Hanseniaspora uvarum]KAF0277708.1 hypothetical protein FOG50_01449 [Hanseniaspora uvarum]OEJ92569.1 37S ribosomal protein MRP17, mitochondrial [Hanseniaspora uvarum]GMM40174.1 mitochondrial 37S ribosomal protein YmS16 [Hanseniaspora uvarum]
MLYELRAILRTPKLLGQKRHADAKAFCENLGKLVLNNRGVVRKIENNGLFQFQNLIRKHGEYFFEGYKVTLLYDCSPIVQQQIKTNLSTDPRVISCKEFSHNLTLKEKTTTTATERMYNSSS